MLRSVDMRRRDFVSLIPASLLAQEEPPPIRVDVNLVNVPFTASGPGGRLTTALTRDDLEVHEDGQLQRITHFSAAGDSPVALGLIADASGSQKDFLKDHERDLRDFLRSVLRPVDQALLVCFGNHIRVVSDWSADSALLVSRLRHFHKTDDYDVYPKLGPAERRAAGTAFHDALVHTANERLSGAAISRRALLVFSDGEDNASAHHLLDAIEAAQSSGATVFCVRYTEVKKGRWNSRNKYGRAVMDRLAQETGGLSLDADAEDLRDAFARIAAMLRAGYDLAYSSTSGPGDGSFRKIRIRSRNPGLTFRHKTGYFAKASEPVK